MRFFARGFGRWWQIVHETEGGLQKLVRLQPGTVPILVSIAARSGFVAAEAGGICHVLVPACAECNRIIAAHGLATDWRPAWN
ncbi:3-oxoacyl-(acyl-carrier-protein) synthase [Comamonas testosteroni TK102]|uniref:3-oxoacyl-(Acyl-carrier-protein) synthase n=1 Tax=Comamonas testosteroni TK102 TaxID=1392005 RepID=A0A076PRJ2_COMTE|nr:3-oxoacyl-(acyl-carrier-protein) synthase [Comamonas testosteroni TK102]